MAEKDRFRPAEREVRTMPAQHEHNFVQGEQQPHPSVDAPDQTPKPSIKNPTSAYTTMKEPLRPVDMSFEKAQSLGDPTEHSGPSDDSSPELSTEVLEKGSVASILTQKQVAAQNHGKPDVALMAKKGHTPNASDTSSWRISLPPDEMPQLPYKRERRIWRRLRHNLFSVYQRLFTLVFIGNMIAFIIEVVMHRHSKPFGPPLGNVATAGTANILGAILIRQEIVINGLYTIFCSTPLWMPLRIRCMLAKLYHFGGVHSGCAISATVWFMLYTALVTEQQADGELDQLAVVVIAYILLVGLLAICLFAIPNFRLFSHNTFEAVHRFAGWSAVALFWVEIVLVLHAQAKDPGSNSLGILVVKAPAFWLLLVTTFFIVLPWLQLRKVTAYPEVLSSHAVRIHFKYMKVAPVRGIRITHNPMKEWHAFASIPEADGSSFSLLVSDNGDWTKKQIMLPAKSYWVRGIPTTGVLRMASVFKRVVIITTGSGIGPVLSMLVGHPLSCRILWSTPNPVETYGESILTAVANADPDAMIINTRASGRPDIVALTYHLYLEAQAEAVFCISNPPLTRKVVYAMESRGIPAFGPIWDS